MFKRKRSAEDFAEEIKAQDRVDEAIARLALERCVDHVPSGIFGIRGQTPEIAPGRQPGAMREELSNGDRILLPSAEGRKVCHCPSAIPLF